MKDPRSEVYTLLESVEGGNELKESLKAFIDAQVDEKIKAKTALDEVNEQFQSVQSQFEELKSQPKLDPADIETERTRQLEETLNELKQRVEQAEKEKAEAAKVAEQAELRQAFLSTTNLRDEIANDKVELALVRGELLIQDGQKGGLVGGQFVPIEDYAKHLDESNSAFLKTVAGGKQGGAPNGAESAVVPTGQEKVVSAITKAGGSLPEFR